jgi:hypothetical protein
MTSVSNVLLEVYFFKEIALKIAGFLMINLYDPGLVLLS